MIQTLPEGVGAAIGTTKRSDVKNLVSLVVLIGLVVSVVVISNLLQTQKIGINPQAAALTQKTAQLVLNPDADTVVDKSRPTATYGRSTRLEIDGSPVKISYLRFDLNNTALSGKTIVAAKLRLKVADGSVNIQNIKFVDNTTWNETSINYRTRPTLNPTVVAKISGAKTGIWYEVDLSTLVTKYISSVGLKKLSMGIDSTGFDGMTYFSKENTTNKPELVITYTTPPSVPGPKQVTGTSTFPSGDCTSYGEIRRDPPLGSPLISLPYYDAALADDLHNFYTDKKSAQNVYHSVYGYDKNLVSDGQAFPVNYSTVKLLGRVATKRDPVDPNSYIVYVGVINGWNDNSQGIQRVRYTPATNTYTLLAPWNSTLVTPTGATLGTHALSFDSLGNLFLATNIATVPHSLLWKCAVGDALNCTQLMALETASGIQNVTGSAINASTNTIYFADSTQKAIVVASTVDGHFMGKFSTWLGGPATMFTNPVDVDVDGSGYLYVADQGDDRIWKFQITGDGSTLSYVSNFLVTNVPADTLKPWGVAVDSTGNRLYVAEGDTVQDKGSIHKYFCIHDLPSITEPIGYWQFESAAPQPHLGAIGNSSPVVDSEYPLSVNQISLPATSNVVGISGRARELTSTSGSYSASIVETTGDVLGYLKPKQALTVSSWVKIPSPLTDKLMTIVSFTDRNPYDSNADFRSGYGLYAKKNSAAGNWSFEFSVGDRTAGGNTAIYTSTADMTVWHNLVGVYDGSSLKIYFDGVKYVDVLRSGIITYTDVLPPNTILKFQMMNTFVDFATVQYHLKGAVDEVKVYNRALSDAEIAGGFIGPTSTPMPIPTNTPIPPTATPVPPTSTPIPPTPTPASNLLMMIYVSPNSAGPCVVGQTCSSPLVGESIDIYSTTSGKPVWVTTLITNSNGEAQAILNPGSYSAQSTTYDPLGNYTKNLRKLYPTAFSIVTGQVKSLNLTVDSGLR